MQLFVVMMYISLDLKVKYLYLPLVDHGNTDMTCYCLLSTIFLRL